MVHASTEDAPAVVDAATDMTTTEPEDLGARLGANLAARPVLSLKAPAPTSPPPSETAEEGEAAVDGGFFAKFIAMATENPLPFAAGGGGGVLLLFLFICCCVCHRCRRRRPKKGGRTRESQVPPRARPRRPTPPLTAACSRALSLPQSWSRYQVSPRGFTPREKTAPGFDDVSPYGSERRPPPGRPLGAFQPGHDTVGRRINDGRVAPVNTHANWKRAAPPPGDSAAHYGGERGIQGDMALPPPPLHVRPSLGTAGVALQKIASRGLEKMGSSGGGRFKGLVREDSMSLVSANSNDNFDEPSQEEFSQPPAWVAQSGGVQDRLPAYHTTL